MRGAHLIGVEGDVIVAEVIVTSWFVMTLFPHDGCRWGKHQTLDHGADLTQITDVLTDDLHAAGVPDIVRHYG